MKAICAAMLLAMLAAGPALADHRSEYKAYMTALDAGDHAEAARRGEAAWRAAEVELGESPATAILAFNYAELIVVAEPAKAIEPYARVKEIASKVETGIAGEDIEAGLAFATFAVDRTDRDGGRRLEAALNARRAKGLPATRLSGYGWLLLAGRRSAVGDVNGSRRFADFAIADAEAMRPAVNKELLRTALVLGAIARVAGRQHTEEEVYQAVKLFARAFPLFPPQKDIDSFDRTLAIALAWRYSVNALALSQQSSVAGNLGEDLSKALREAAGGDDGTQWVRWAEPRPKMCLFLWASQPNAKYPAAASNRSIVGTALIGFDVSGLAVERAVVLADIYKSNFGRAALKSVKRWTLAKPASERCRKNNLAFFIYHFE